MRGKDFRNFIAVIRIKDHPRLCGEKYCFGVRVDSSVGSPPPMRGKGYSSDRQTEQSRITPAYAGKSHKNENGDTEFEDHPRLCGEKIFRFASDGEIIGSPPPMRGKVDIVFILCYNKRITPAYAGKSGRL